MWIANIIHTCITAGSLMVVMGSVILGIAHADAHAQELHVFEVGAADYEAVDFDVPIPVKIRWPASIRDQLSDVDFPEIERRLLVYRLTSRREPPLVRFPADETSACGAYGCWKDESGSVASLADSTGLHVVLDRLRANRYYRFRFVIRRSLTGREEEAFEKSAVAALERLFREPVEGPLDESRRKEIQRAMIDAVRDATAMQVRPKRGSFFDDTLADTDLPTGSKKSFDDLYTDLGTLATLASRINRDANARNLTPGVRKTGELYRATAALERLGLAASTLIALHLLVSELRIEERRSGITRSVVVDSLHLLSEAAYQLGVMDDDVRMQMANGQYALSRYGQLSPSLPTIVDIRTPAQLEKRAQNIEATAETLDRLAYLADQVKHLSEYRRSSQGRTIGDAEMDTLRARLEDASASLRRVPRHDRAYLALKEDLAARQAIFAAFVGEALERFAEEEVYATAASTANFRTRADMYISADLGVAHAPGIDEISPYFGVNIYPFPVNKDAALRSFGFGESLFRRTAFTFGVTATSIEREGERVGLVGDLGLLAGIGVRITDAMRISTGALFFDEVDPLTNGDSIARRGFVSISLDWDVRGSLGGLRDAVFN